MRFHLKRCCSLLGGMLFACGFACADRQQFDESTKTERPMVIMPAPTGFKLDGNLKAWNTAGKIGPSTFDEDAKDDYNATFYAMYDAEYLYLAAVVVEPHPPYNTYPNKGIGAFNGDDVIVRMSSNPKLAVPIVGSGESLSTSPDLFTAEFWLNNQKNQDCWDGYYGVSGDHMTADKMPGIAMLVKVAADSKGYTTQVKVPWPLVNPAFHPKPGDRIAFAWEVSIANNNPVDPTRAFQIFANGGGIWAFNNPGLWGKAIFK